MDQKTRYLAFISYRHADNKTPGRQWATWLHQAIETYQVPDQLVGKTNSRGEEIPSRIFPVFRDEEALPADADLESSIKIALDNSALLIVLCSPRANASKYVADEIDYFKKLGRSDRIIAAMIDGEPNASWDTSKHNESIGIESECFPEPLRVKYDQGGNPTGELAEPIAADFHLNLNGLLQQGFTSPEALKLYLQKQPNHTKKDIQRLIADYEKQIELMKLKIIAGIIGVPLDELTQRDKAYQLELERQKSRRLKQISAMFAMIAFIAIWTGWSAYSSKLIADERRDSALTTQSLFLADLAQQHIEQEDYNTALLLALNAMPGTYGDYEGNTRPFSPQAQDSLSVAAYRQHKAEEFSMLRQNAMNSSDVKYGFIHNERVILLFHPERVTLWSLETGKRLQAFEHSNDTTPKHIGAISGISHDGQKVLIETIDNAIALWEIQTGQLLHVFKHSEEISSAAFSTDGKTILTASYDNTATLWNVDTGEQIRLFQHKYDVEHASFSPDGHSILTVSNNNTATLWSLETKEPLQELKYKGNFDSAIFSPDGNTIFIATWESDSFEDSVYLWSTQTGENLHTSKFDEFWSAEFSPDGRTLLLRLKDDAVLLSVETGQYLKSFNHEELIRNVEFSPNGTEILTVYFGNHAALWSAQTGQRLKKFQHDDEVYTAEFSSDGLFLLTTSKDKSAGLWSTKTGRRLGFFQHEESVRSAIFSKDGRFFLTLTNTNLVTLWSLEALGKVQEFNVGEHVDIYDFTSDGKSIITLSNEGLLRWRIEDKTFGPYSGGLLYVDFSPDYRTVLTGAKDKTAAIWSIETGEKLREFAHTNKISSAKFSPNGMTILTTSYNNPAILWSVENGERLHVLDQGKYKQN